MKTTSVKPRPRRRKKRAYPHMNGMAAPFLEVVKVAERSIEKLTALTGQQERIAVSIESNTRSQLELAAAVKEIRDDLAESPSRTEKAVEKIEQCVAEEADETRATVRAEGHATREKFVLRRKHVFWVAIALIGTIVVAQAIDKGGPLLSAAWKWFLKFLGAA